jgi:2'-5' RNA ligase
MGSNLVIAAIPDENDRVWKVSSEKVPHLTLLFLGDVEAVKNLDQIILFVEHAANTTLRRFYLSVDRRGELGADQADVLFFKIGRYEYKTIRDFRAALLQDNNIKTAYDSSTQFDGVWQPHLTLGYPATPAKDVPDDYTFYDVAFNKIAVWTNDFDGPEFLLKDYGDEINLADFPMDIAMSDTRVANLQHHGIKGMKWGTRRPTLTEAVPGGTRIRIDKKTGKARLSDSTGFAVSLVGPLAFVSPKVRADVKAARAVNKSAQADKKWKKQLTSAKKAVIVHNTAAAEFNSKISDFNNDKRWKDAAGKDIDLTKDPAKMEEYNRTVERELLNSAFSRAAVAVHGSQSPGKRYKFEIKDENTATLKLTDTLQNKELPSHRVLHAVSNISDITDNTDNTEITITYRIMRNSNGYILGFEPDVLADELSQAAKLGEAFVLEHHGIKGMRWGMRKANVSSGARAAGGAVKKAAKATGKAVGAAADNTLFEVSKKEQWVTNDIIEGAHERLRKDLPGIKAKHGDYAKLKNRIKKPFSSEAKAYRQDVKKAYIRHLESSANSMTNLRGTRQYTLTEFGQPNTSKYFWNVSTRTVQHADPGMVTVRPIFDSEGWITDIETVPDSMAQTIELGADFLKHYGVKGMHWGVRREQAVTTQTHIDTGLLRRKTQIQAKGGQSHPAHEDAVKVEVARQKLKKSGAAALSNRELRDMRDRIQLETQVKSLMTKKGKKQVQKQLEESGKQQLQKGIGIGVAKGAPHVLRKARKAGAVAGAAAALA